MPKTRAQENRAIRQDALREQLANKGLIQHVIEIAKKLAEPDIDQTRVQALKASAELQLKLIDKYLPNLQSVEGTFSHTHTRADNLTDEQLANIAAGGSARTTEAQDSAEVVH